MSKIEINEYVRTKNGTIDKVINSNFYMNIYVECAKGLYLIENIVKRSKQLIGLIEVGDIVEIRTGLHSSFKYFVEDEEDLLLLEEKVKEFWNIETILTKEQYMANCYKVGGKNG